MRQYIIIITCLFSSLQPIAAQVTIQRLRCEMLNNPLGVDVTSPRLSWQLQSTERNVEQTAYHILVASSKEKLNSNAGDLWNSGKISSSQSIHISYSGQPLQSGKPYFWKVKAFTTKGETQWSEMAYWSTGLLNESDWKAKWIGYDKASIWDSITQWSRLSARYLRREFQSASIVKRATVYISGLGMYELYINGKKIGDQVLAPNPTDYRKTYFYNTHDVTTQIKAGTNAIGAVLGNDNLLYFVSAGNTNSTE